MGQIVAWQLERVLPGRRVQVDMRAECGAILEGMHQKLAGLTYRPDALLLFSGHNEFESRFTWRRNIRYYVDEQLATPVATMLECALRWSPFCRLILETQERQRLDATPDPIIKRQLVDQPVCSRQERRRHRGRLPRQARVDRRVLRGHRHASHLHRPGLQ